MRKKVKWLQWAYHDLNKELGGVETHAVSLARELKIIGIEPYFSSKIEDLTQEWDVIHTHGSMPIPFQMKQKIPGNPIFVHTLHGTTLGRMFACKEWFWVRGYFAYIRELIGCLQSDVICSIHANLHLFQFFKNFSTKTVTIVGNGWDSFEVPQVNGLSQEKTELCLSFVGRGEDKVKNTFFLEKVFFTLKSKYPSLHVSLKAIPGTGLSKNSNIIKTGRLSPEATAIEMKKSDALLLTSFYEGLPLVVLEALSQGVPVIASNVGGIKTLPSECKGLYRINKFFVNKWVEIIYSKVLSQFNQSTREQNSIFNSNLLKKWKNVAEIYIEATKVNRLD